MSDTPDVIAEIRDVWPIRLGHTTHSQQCHLYHASCAIAVLLDRIDARQAPHDIDAAALVAVLRATAADRPEVRGLLTDAARTIEGLL